MSVSWLLVAVAALIGAGLAWRGPKVAGGALLLGAVVLALGLGDVAGRLPSRPAAGTSSGEDAPWVLRVQLDAGTSGRTTARLTSGWAELPGFGTARVRPDGVVIVRGEPGSGRIEMHAVAAALRATPHVASVRSVDDGK